MLDEQIAEVRRELVEYACALPRLFLIETEYGPAMLEAEAEWARSLRAELEAGTFPERDRWRAWATGEIDMATIAEEVKGGAPRKTTEPALFTGPGGGAATPPPSPGNRLGPCPRIRIAHPAASLADTG